MLPNDREVTTTGTIFLGKPVALASPAPVVEWFVDQFSPFASRHLQGASRSCQKQAIGHPPYHPEVVIGLTDGPVIFSLPIWWKKKC